MASILIQPSHHWLIKIKEVLPTSSLANQNQRSIAYVIIGQSKSKMYCIRHHWPIKIKEVLPMSSLGQSKSKMYCLRHHWPIKIKDVLPTLLLANHDQGNDLRLSLAKPNQLNTVYGNTDQITINLTKQFLRWNRPVTIKRTLATLQLSDQSQTSQ